jgi:hypothetical protein
MYKIASATAVVVVVSILSQPALAGVEPDGTHTEGGAKVIQGKNVDPLHGEHRRTRLLPPVLIEDIVASSPHCLIATLGGWLAIVLCAIGFLTKQRLYSFGAVAASLVGLVEVGIGLVL